MEEIINRLAKAVATYPIEARNYPNCIVFREDLENLINKYKEQEKIIKKYKAYSKSTYDDYANAIVRLQEQEKTIQLMSEELAELNYEYCGKWCKGKKCKDYYENHFIDEESCNGNKLSCIIDYFKKKAKGE